MSPSPPRVSLGALALVVCLALPAGLMSLFARTTTGEQVDLAELVLVGRVASLQVSEDPPVTSIGFAVDHTVIGQLNSRSFNILVDGRAPLTVGDEVLAILSRRPTSLLGIYQIEQDLGTLRHEVVTPVTGMLAQGVNGGGPYDPVPLALLEAAIRLRQGLGQGALPGGQVGTIEAGPLPPDPNEPNDDTGNATFVSGLHLPTFVTGNPTLVSGVTIDPQDDVDFYKFTGQALSLINAETLGVSGLRAPDTFMGVFDPGGNLIEWDDNDGQGAFSLLRTPLPTLGDYFVAVQSAPDTAMPPDFDGDEGTTIGAYELSLELELGQYIWNTIDRIAGVSMDGTLIEDFIGYEIISGIDPLTEGAQADGWGVRLDVGPGGVTPVFGGAGDQLTDPGFTNAVAPLSFEIGPFQDVNGMNRRGHANAASIVLIDQAAHARFGARGIVVTFDYTLSIADPTIVGDIALQMGTDDEVSDLVFSRVTDVDMYGDGNDDEFFWSFDATGKVSAFPVDLSTNVGNVVVPGQPFGNSVGDQQAAVVIEHGDSNGGGFGDVTHYLTAFTLVEGHPTANTALQDAVRRLRNARVDAWVIVVDDDPDTGLYGAFGTGLGEL